MTGSWKRPALLLLMIILVTAGVCALRPRPDVIITDFAMDTVVTIRVPAGQEKAARQAVAELRRLEKIFNRHDPDSEIARVNRGAGGWVPVGREVLAVLVLVEDMTPLTGGLFDVTVGPLLDRWGFGTGEDTVPEPADLAAARELVGGHWLELDRAGSRVRLARPGMVIDLGGVAKGYAIDQAVRVLRDQGVRSGMVDVGGDLYLLGTLPGGPWRVGVRHPRQPGTFLGVLHLEDQAVATSGDYQRFFEQDGIRYHHLLDPRTGMPGRRAVSATVVAPTAALADLLATAVFLLGPEAGLALLEDLPETEGIIVGPDGEVNLTTGLAGPPVPYFKTR